MPRVIVFTEDNARVLYTDTPDLWADTPEAVIEPDLKEVTGVAPHFWKLVDGKILPMTDLERAARHDYHSRNVALNIIPKPHLKVVIQEPEQTSQPLPEPAQEPKSYNKQLVWTLAAFAALAALSWVMWR